MISTVLSEVKGLVDPRFLLTAFFPVFVFALVCGLLVASGHGGIDQVVITWEGYSGNVQLIVVIGAMSAVFLVATFAASSAVLLTQLYEGYFGPKKLLDLGKKTQQGRRSDATHDVDLLFPDAELVKPTALGNVLYAAETYPLRAYGVNAFVAWPRLFLLVPERLLTSMTGPRDTMHFLLLTSFLSTLIGVVGGIYVIFASLGWAIYLAVVVGGLALAWMCYRGAIEAAADYGLHLRGAFDLHRNELLTALHRAVPATSEEELRTWADVSQRLRRGDPLSVRYVEAPAK